MLTRAFVTNLPFSPRHGLGRDRVFLDDDECTRKLSTLGKSSDNRRVGRGGVLLLLGAGDGSSHKLHQRHLGVDHEAHHGDDPQHRLAAQHGARGFTHESELSSVTEPHRSGRNGTPATNVY